VLTVVKEREEGEVIDSENENEGKNSEQNEKQNTFAEDLIDVLTVENDTSEKEKVYCLLFFSFLSFSLSPVDSLSLFSFFFTFDGFF
jgi:hypothetical protein